MNTIYQYEKPHRSTAERLLEYIRALEKKIKEVEMRSANNPIIQ